MSITMKSAPEFRTIEDFIQFLLDDDRTEFTHEELIALNYRTRTTVTVIRTTLEEYGLALATRQMEKRTRGFTTSSQDRWFGPGSSPTHGGAGYDSLMQQKYLVQGGVLGQNLDVEG